MRSGLREHRLGHIAPCVIRVRPQLYSAVAVYRYNVPLQVLFKPVGIERAFRHTRRPVLHPDRASVRVIQIQAQNIVPFLRDDLRPRQIVVVRDAVHRLAGPDSLIVVRVGTDVVRHNRTHIVLGQLSAIPLHEYLVSVVVRIFNLDRVADLVICDAIPAIRGQQIAPIGVIVTIGNGRIQGRRRCVCSGQRIFLLGEQIPRVVIGIHIGPIGNAVVLPDQLPKVIIRIAICRAVVLRDRGDVPVIVICVKIGLLFS